MQPMHGRLSDPRSYRSLQDFIAHSTWEARPFWQRLRGGPASAPRGLANRPVVAVATRCSRVVLAKAIAGRESRRVHSSRTCPSSEAVRVRA